MSEFLTEASSFDSQVASILTDTPVRGAVPSTDPNTGEINAPLVALTNRTRWLYNNGGGLPSFFLPGQYFVNWSDTAKELTCSASGYKNEVGMYNTEFDGSLDKTSVARANIGKTLLRKEFKRPYSYTKLNLSFLARSSIQLGSLKEVRVLVLKSQAVADSNYWDIVDSALLGGSELYNAPTIRTVQLDLSSAAAGSDLCLLYCVSLPSLHSYGTDFYITLGQLISSWEA
jgi:hypothetical protein